MRVPGTVSVVLTHKKESHCWSISPEVSVFDAIKMMAKRNVGALPVVEGGKVIGMMSERDYTRKVALKGKSSKETKVREIMGTPVITVPPEQPVGDCLRLMTEHRVRHLPVLENGQLIGIVSIGDLVNWIISTQNAHIEQMEQYIAGSAAA